jgi:hypothetical protein
VLRHTPPSIRFDPSLRETDGPRRNLQSRVIHATAGHGYVADYCARLGPAETPSCPCGKALQAREHVLAVVVD